MLQRNTEFSFSMKISKLKDKTGKIPNDLLSEKYLSSVKQFTNMKKYK